VQNICKHLTGAQDNLYLQAQIEDSE
jgi:hypothetical protein